MSQRTAPVDERRKPSIEDFRLGRMAYLAGWMDGDQLALCLQRQTDALQARRGTPRMGDLAIAEGFLSRDQVRALLRVQHLHRLPTDDRSFGAIAVDQGFISRRQLHEALAQQQAMLERGHDSPPIGVLLAERGHLTSEEARQVISIQAERGQGIVPRLEAIAHPQGAPPMDDALERKLQGGRLGYMAFFAGWMTRQQINECLAEQRACEEQGRPMPRVGELAERKGYLTGEQVHALVHLQVIHRPTEFDRMFGAICVRTGWLSQEQVDACLREQVDTLSEQQQAPLLGLMLMEKRLLTPEQVRTVLVAQREYGLGPLAKLGLPDRSGTPVPSHISRLRHPALTGAVAAAVLLTAGAAAASDWFGLLAAEQLEAVVRCRSCRAVTRTSDIESATCPACGARDSVAPLVRCTRCRTVYGYGQHGAGRRCPQCGSRDHTALRSDEDGGDQ